MIKSILVIADCAAGNITALAKARELAAPFNASILVARFINSNPAADVSADLVAAEQALNDDLAQVFSEDERPEHEIVVTDDIATWCKESCIKNGFDLVIKTGHRSESTFYTPTDWHLIRQLPCPVLISSDSKWRAKPAVLASIDLEDDSKIQQELNVAVIQAASQMCECKGSSLSVTYSLPIPKALVELDIIEREAYAHKHEPRLQAEMEKFLATTGVSGASIHVQAGSAEKRIPSLANKLKADLVVVGSVGRKGLKGILLGNTAEKILKQLRTDILVIKPRQ